MLVLFRMEETDALFARAETAIAEAKRLVEMSWVWQSQVRASVRRFHLGAIFAPKEILLKYPQEACEPAGPDHG